MRGNPVYFWFELRYKLANMSMLGIIRPKTSVLDIWARSMSCPICCKTGLQVIREPGVSDFMSCDQCGCEFVFEEDGTRIRFSKTPDRLGNILFGEWMTYTEVHKRLQELVPGLDGPRARVDVVTIPTRRVGSLTQKIEEDALEELPRGLMDQAMGLYRLGNPIPEIREILRRNPKLNEHEIDAALKKVGRYGTGRKVRSWLTAGLVVVVFLAVLGFTVSRGVVPNLIANIRGTIDQKTSLLIPVTGGAASSPPAACPTSSAAAAQLFGGKSAYWTYEAPKWYYQDVHPVNIYIPDGMEATYPSLTSKSMIDNLKGPAEIYNVMAVSITCYY